MSKHVGQVLVVSQGYVYQATCSCGWHKRVNYSTLPQAAAQVRKHVTP